MRMLADVRQKTIRPVIEATVAKGARVHTDECGVYAHLPAWGYRHKTVCHVAGSMRATRTATASARSTSTPWRGHGVDACRTGTPARPELPL
jgi:ISXO2 transposase-like protein